MFYIHWLEGRGLSDWLTVGLNACMNEWLCLAGHSLNCLTYRPKVQDTDWRTDWRTVCHQCGLSKHSVHLWTAHVNKGLAGAEYFQIVWSSGSSVRETISLRLPSESQAQSPLSSSRSFASCQMLNVFYLSLSTEFSCHLSTLNPFQLTSSPPPPQLSMQSALQSVSLEWSCTTSSSISLTTTTSI